jgi:hypothetical protein
MVVLHDLSDREMRCLVISRGCIGANTANAVVEQTQAHGNRTFVNGVPEGDHLNSRRRDRD